MKLLALDVSTVVVGYAIGDHLSPLTDVSVGSLDLGNPTPSGKPRLPLERRLQALQRSSERLLRDYRPDVVAIECPDVSGRHHFRSGSHHTDLALGLAIGGVIAMISQAKLPFVLWDARLVRERLLGNGSRPKESVQWYLHHVHSLNLPARRGGVDDDACDAAALWVAQSDEMRATAKEGAHAADRAG